MFYLFFFRPFFFPHQIGNAHFCQMAFRAVCAGAGSVFCLGRVQVWVRVLLGVYARDGQG